jgi:ribosomal protein S6--L-glutamate ligase
MEIAILSTNSSLYSVQRIQEEGQKRGHHMRIINPLKANIEMDDEGAALYYNGKYLTNIDAIIPRIGVFTSFYGTAVVRQFEMQNIFTINKARAIVHSHDKLRCYQLLAKHKIGQPKTIFTNYSKNVEHVVESAGGTPVVLKLLHERAGVGAVLAEDKSSAESVLEAFNGLKARAIVQEYIQEAQGSDIRIMVLGDEVIGAVKRFKKNRDFQSSQAKRKKPIPINLSDQEIAIAIKAAKVVELGFACVDIVRSHRGPLVLKISSSPGLQQIEPVANINVAEKLILHIEKTVGDAK